MDWGFLKGLTGVGQAGKAPWGQMDTGQRLGSIGSILSGDMSGLGLIMKQLQGGSERAPRNDDYAAYAEAFGGGQEAGQGGAAGPVQSRPKRKFGFGRG